jgi:hypothetical protein
MVLDLSAMSRAEKVDYATRVLGTVATVRSAAGVPHWLVIDEAHHVFPRDGAPAAPLLDPGPEALCLSTLSAEDLAPAVRPLANVVASTDLDAFAAAARVVAAARAAGAPRVAGGRLHPGEAMLGRLDGGAAARFRIQRRRVTHRRHVRKYTEGELPPERSFFFRGPRRELNLRAANLVRFVELAEGVDEATWLHHLRGHDYSRWIREVIKDPELAAAVAASEASPAPAAESRRRVLEEIRRRYAV